MYIVVPINFLADIVTLKQGRGVFIQILHSCVQKFRYFNVTDCSNKQNLV